jgi:hypothetical protein
VYPSDGILSLGSKEGWWFSEGSERLGWVVGSKHGAEDAGSDCRHGVMVHHPLVKGVKRILPGFSAAGARALEEM